MVHDRSLSRAWLRGAALAAVSALGLITIAGSGGGDAPECSFFSNVCYPNVAPSPAPPVASAFPLTVTVQAGTSAVFTGQSSGIDRPSYQWRRSADGGVNFVDVAGATGQTYTLTPAQLADDGALFRVDVRSGNIVLATSNATTLLVSSMPAVVFADGEFDAAEWSSTAMADPSQNGPTYSEDRSATGGLPGAFRRMVHTMTAGPSRLRVFNSKVSAVYDPQALGAIHAIDHSEDCSRIGASSSSFEVASFPTIEQAGRRFVSTRGRGCLALWVNNVSPLPSLRAGDYVLVDGPACGSGASCPDFSNTGAPLRFGFERRVGLLAGAPAGAIEHGIDNWKVSVWRP